MFKGLISKSNEPYMKEFLKTHKYIIKRNKEIFDEHNFPVGQLNENGIIELTYRVDSVRCIESGCKLQFLLDKYDKEYELSEERVAKAKDTLRKRANHYLTLAEKLKSL